MRRASATRADHSRMCAPTGGVASGGVQRGGARRNMTRSIWRVCGHAAWRASGSGAHRVGAGGKIDASDREERRKCSARAARRAMGAIQLCCPAGCDTRCAPCKRQSTGRSKFAPVRDLGRFSVPVILREPGRGPFCGAPKNSELHKKPAARKAPQKARAAPRRA